MILITLRLLRMAAGILLILFGVIAGFIPILQGWIFILAGLALLGIKPHQVKEYAVGLRDKYWYRRKPTQEPD